MDNPKEMMLIASIIGAIGGIIFNASINPINNYYIFAAIFALIGIMVTLLILVVLDKIYEWAKE